MAKPSVKTLKLHTGKRPQAVSPPPEAIASLPEVLRAFAEATGWSLRYVTGPEPSPTSEMRWSAPVSPGVGAALGHLALEPLGPGPAGGATKPVDPDAALEMASALAGMLAEMMKTQHALRQREAELAAGVPPVPYCEDPQHLALRLEAALRAGAEAVDCQAAGLYLLDEATTELKLRSSWGLSLDRLIGPARPLKGALGDLEALLGHAVVLEDTELMRRWRVPEDFPAAVCVPVSTPTTLLGTVWFFCTSKRDFSDRQTNILEVVAARIAADLERETLLHEEVEAATIKRQLAAAERQQRNQLPTIPPQLDDWQVAGWTGRAEAVGGGFYDWFCLPDGRLAVAVGEAMDRGIPAAMSASALRAALRAHGQYHREADRALRQINLTLWSGSAGDQFAALFFGLIELATGLVCFSSAGHLGAIVVRSDAWESLPLDFPPLGESPETNYEPAGYELQPREALVVFACGCHEPPGRRRRVPSQRDLAQRLVGHADLSADDLLALARDYLNTCSRTPSTGDRTLLVVRRRRHC